MFQAQTSVQTTEQGSSKNTITITQFFTGEPKTHERMMSAAAVPVCSPHLSLASFLHSVPRPLETCSTAAHLLLYRSPRLCSTAPVLSWHIGSFSGII